MYSLMYIDIIMRLCKNVSNDGVKLYGKCDKK